MDAIKNALNVKANEYRQQELLGSIVAATVIGFGSKYVSQLPTKTIAAAALNGFGLAVSAKSVRTIYSNWSKTDPSQYRVAIDERNSAYKALMASVLIMTATTLLRATNFVDTKFSAAPEVNKHLKPLVFASAGTVVFSEIGIKTLKGANAWNNKRIKDNEDAAQKRAEAAQTELVGKLAMYDVSEVKQMGAEDVKALAADLTKALEFNKAKETPDDVSDLDGLIAAVNARGGDKGLKIGDWKDVA